MDELTEILNGNAERRAQAQQDQAAAEEAAADLADRVRHHGESDEQRAARRQREADRERLRAAGVQFTDG